MVDGVAPNQGAQGQDQDGPKPVDTKPMRDDTNPKRQGMAEIAAKRRALLEGELNEQGVSLEDDQPADQPEPAPRQEEPQPEPAPHHPQQHTPHQEPQPTSGQDPEPHVPMVRVERPDGTSELVPASNVHGVVKIDGQERETTFDEVTRQYQMDGAADRRFSEAKRMLDEVRRERREWNQQRTREPGDEPAADATPAPAAAPKPTDEEIAAKAEEISKTLQIGSEEEIKQAVMDLMTANQGQTIDPNQITESVMAQVRANQEHQKDLDAFAAAYPAIADDVYLGRLTADTIHTIRNFALTDLGIDTSKMTFIERQREFEAQQRKGAIPDIPDTRALYLTAGEAVKQWGQRYGMQLQAQPNPAPANGADPSPASPAPSAPAGGMQDRVQRKRSMPQPPATATAFNRGAPEPAKASGSDIVANMRRARGQPVA